MTARAACVDGYSRGATWAWNGGRCDHHPATRSPGPQDEPPSVPLDRGSRGHIGWIVAGSLAVGLVVALLLVAAPFIPAEESRVTGAVLCGFAVGWVLLAVLSVRFTDQPQRWAVVPALLMGLGGLVLMGFGSSVQAVLNWVWPPVMLALAIWVFVRVHRQLRSRGARWLLYLVFGVLALASIGGGYETVREAMDARAYPAPGRLIDVGGHRLHLSCTGSGIPRWCSSRAPAHVLESGVDHSGGSPRHPGLRLRPCGSWMERARGRPSGRHADRDRPAHVAAAREGPRTVRAGGPLLRRALRAHLRRPLPRRGCRHGADRLHRPGLGGSGSGVTRRPDVLRRHGPCLRVGVELGSAGSGGCSSTLAASGLPPRSRDEMSAKMATASSLRSTIDEYVQAIGAQQAAALTDFGDKPLVVLTAGSGQTPPYGGAEPSGHLVDQQRAPRHRRRHPCRAGRRARRRRRNHSSCP